MIYYIKHFKRIERTSTHTDVDLSKVRAMYHQWDMAEYHKDPKVVPTVNAMDWPKTLETVEKYTRGFHRLDGKSLSYGFREDLIALVAAHDPTYHANVIEYFTHDEEMIFRGSILSGHAVIGTDPEEIGPFTDYFISQQSVDLEQNGRNITGIGRMETP